MLMFAPQLFVPRSTVHLLVAGNPVSAGFPSPAEDFSEPPIDLNEHLVRHPTATFVFTARGDSMTGAGIQDGDRLIVDRSVSAGDGDVVIAVTDGDFVVKTLRRRGGAVWLCAANPKYPPIQVTDPDAQVWGVVMWALHRVRVS